MFSICIPNFNYGRYLGGTITAALQQTANDFEVLLSDNASTDDSLSVARAFQDPRLKIRSNAYNLGFSQNLHAVGDMASGDWMLLLSSDDLIEPEALSVYHALIKHYGGGSSGRVILAAGAKTIDAEGNTIAAYRGKPYLWAKAELDTAASRLVGVHVYSMPAKSLLSESLRLLRTPLPFLSTAYPREAYLDVGGFGSSQTINPDKHLAWRLMAVCDTVHYVDAPLFAYRAHASNQNAAQVHSGALKHLTDQYTITYALQDFVLKQAGFTRSDLAKAFVEQDIALRGLVALAEGDLRLAQRSLAFGRATYPELIATSPRARQLDALLRLGPLGAAMARFMRKKSELAWRRSQESSSEIS